MPPAPRAPIISRLQLHSFVIGSAFIGTSISIAIRQSKLLCLGLSSKLFFDRVWVTPRLPYIPLGVAFDKTPNTSKKKFVIGRLILSILNPSNLVLTKLQNNLISINFFKKVMAGNDGKERWRRKMMTSLPTYLSPYALVSLRTLLLTVTSVYQPEEHSA